MIVDSGRTGEGGRVGGRDEVLKQMQSVDYVLPSRLCSHISRRRNHGGEIPREVTSSSASSEGQPAFRLHTHVLHIHTYTHSHHGAT